jgi:hypothetical protein
VTGFRNPPGSQRWGLNCVSSAVADKGCSQNLDSSLQVRLDLTCATDQSYEQAIVPAYLKALLRRSSKRLCMIPNQELSGTWRVSWPFSLFQASVWQAVSVFCTRISSFVITADSQSEDQGKVAMSVNKQTTSKKLATKRSQWLRQTQPLNWIAPRRESYRCLSFKDSRPCLPST